MRGCRKCGVVRRGNDDAVGDRRSGVGRRSYDDAVSDRRSGHDGKRDERRDAAPAIVGEMFCLTVALEAGA